MLKSVLKSSNSQQPTFAETHITELKQRIKTLTAEPDEALQKVERQRQIMNSHGLRPKLTVSDNRCMIMT